MKFTESYIRKIIREAINEEEPPVQIVRPDMMDVLRRIDTIIAHLSPAIPATDLQALEAMSDLEQLKTWFDKHLGGADGGEPNWPEPTEEEKYGEEIKVKREDLSELLAQLEATKSQPKILDEAIEKLKEIMHLGSFEEEYPDIAGADPNPLEENLIKGKRNE